MHPPRICLREVFTPFTSTGKKPGTRRVMGESRRSPRGAPRCPASDKRSSRGLSRPRHNLYTGNPSVALKATHPYGRPVVAPTPPRAQVTDVVHAPRKGDGRPLCRASPVRFPQSHAPVGATTGRPQIRLPLVWLPPQKKRKTGDHRSPASPAENRAGAGKS